MSEQNERQESRTRISGLVNRAHERLAGMSEPEKAELDRGVLAKIHRSIDHAEAKDVRRTLAGTEAAGRAAYERFWGVPFPEAKSPESGFTVTRLPSGRVECVFGENKVSAGTDVEAVGLMREVLAEMECPSGGSGLAARAVADACGKSE